MKAVIGFALTTNYLGKTVPVVGRTIYAQAVATNALFMQGTAWAPAYYPTPVPVNYPRAISSVTDAAGQFHFQLFSDQETYLPNGATTEWLIFDPISGLSYRGRVLNSLLSPIDVADLVKLHNWVVEPVGQVVTGPANERRGRILFQDNLQEALITLVPPMPNAGYVAMASGATDDIGDLNYDAYIKPGQTTSEFTIRLSSPVPPPRQVLISWTVQG